MSNVECRVSSFGVWSFARTLLSPPSLCFARALRRTSTPKKKRSRRGKKRGKNSPSRSLASFFPLFSLALLFRTLNLPSLSLSLAPQSRPPPSTAIHTHGISPRPRDRESARRRRTHAVAVAFFPISFTRKPALAFFSTDDDGDNDERPTAKRRKWTAVAAPSLASCISNAPCLVECIMRND